MINPNHKSEGTKAKIPNYEGVRFTIDVPEEGIKKGSYGTVVSSNGSPVDSYMVDVAGKDFPVTVHASEIELVKPTKAKPTPSPNAPSAVPQFAFSVEKKVP